MKKNSFDLFFVIVVLSVLFSVFANNFKNRVDFILTGVEQPAYPQPFWRPARIETGGSLLGMKLPEGSAMPVGSDYVQVYLSARALRLGEQEYNIMDPFGRVSNYPPLVNWAYIPFSLIYYPLGLLLHNFLTMGLFMAVSFAILLQSGNMRFAWKVLIIYWVLYFFTPLGYSHFEKGQFDFYAAGAHLLPAVIFVGGAGLPYFFTVGLMGAFKWSSLPFLGAFSAAAFLASENRKRWYFVIPLAMIVVSALLFWPEFLKYLPSLQAFELNYKEPIGLTFWHFMPKPLAKSFQIICLALFNGLFLYVSRKGGRQKMFEKISLPFALAMAAQGLCFGSISLEYRVVSLLGLVVPFLLWVQKAEVDEKIKIMMAISFGGFLVFVFRNFQYLLHPTDAQMTVVFLIASLFWLGTACAMLFVKREHPEQNEMLY